MEKERVAAPPETPKKSGPALVSLNPPHHLTFSKDKAQSISDKNCPTSNLTLTNITDKTIAYKIKTTRPKNYCVRPNSGTLPPQGKAEVQVVLQLVTEAEDFPKHKFLVQTMIVNGTATEDMWKNAGDDVIETKLKCSWDEGNSATIAPPAEKQAPEPTPAPTPAPVVVPPVAKPEEKRTAAPAPPASVPKDEVKPVSKPTPPATTTPAPAPAPQKKEETPAVVAEKKPISSGTPSSGAAAGTVVAGSKPSKSDSQTLILLIVVFILGIIYGKFVM